MNHNRSLRMSAVLSTIAVVPFVALELKNRPQDDFPFHLFGLLWLLFASCAFVLSPVVRQVRHGETILGAPVVLLARIALAILLGTLWGGLLLNQMPCFLGIPSCD